MEDVVGGEDDAAAEKASMELEEFAAVVRVVVGVGGVTADAGPGGT